MRQPFRFTLNFDVMVGPGRLVAYKAGHELIIPRDHAAAAVKAGAGEFVSAPKPRKVKG